MGPKKEQVAHLRAFVSPVALTTAEPLSPYIKHRPCIFIDQILHGANRFSRFCWSVSHLWVSGRKLPPA